VSAGRLDPIDRPVSKVLALPNLRAVIAASAWLAVPCRGQQHRHPIRTAGLPKNVDVNSCDLSVGTSILEVGRHAQIQDLISVET
jgi:hypothetical protein